jgi:hypothetical protein
MKTRLLLLACAAGLLTGSVAAAAPALDDSKNAGPIISVQIQPIDKLLDTFKTTAKNFLPDQIYKEFEKEVLGKLDLNVIKGIDTKKPVGLYASFDAGIASGDFSKCTVVALVPVTDEKDFVALLGQASLNVKKNGDVYSIEIPNAPVQASLRFLKGYAYVGISPDQLNPKTLLDPSEVISDKETAALVLRLRMDRVPEDLKKIALDFFANAAEFPQGANMPAALKEIYGDYMKLAMRRMKMALEDGKEVAYRIDLDPKSGALNIEASVDPKPDTKLAKSIAALKPSKNDFTGIIGSDSAGHILFQSPLFMEDVQELLLKLIDVGAQEAAANMGNEKPEVKEMVAEAFSALKRTVKAGTLDVAASLRGPDRDEKYTAIGAFNLKETAPLEKAIKTALKTAKKDDKVTVDSYKVGDVNVHEVLVAPELPPEMIKIFGKSNIHAALAPDAVFVAFGAHAQDLMKEALTMKPGGKPAPLIHAEVSGTRLLPLIKAAGAPMDGPGGQMLEKFGKLDRVAVLSLKVEGGSRLVLREEIGAVPIVAAIFFLGRTANATFEKVGPAVKGK